MESLLLFVIMVALLFIARKVFRLSIVSPAFLMAFVWVSFISISLVFLKGYSWQYFGIIWLLSACFIFLVGFLVGDMVAHKKWRYDQEKDGQERRLNLNRLKKFFAVSMALGVLYALLKLQSLGFSIADIVNLEKLGEINNSVALTRYYGSGVYSIFLQLLLSFVYLSPLLGGILFSFSQSRRDMALSFLAFIPELLVFSFSNEKATLLACVFLWVSASIVGYLRRYRRYPRLGRARLVGISVLLVGLGVILIVSMMLRIGSVSKDNFEIALQKIGQSYALSHVPAFDHYFVQPRDQTITYGVVTFYGISNFIGLSNREQGVYEDSFSSGDIGTNVFTAFRGLIGDFGTMGALVFQFVAAFCVGIFCYLVRYSRRSSIISIVCLAAAYTFILYSFIVSVFSYLSIIMAFVFFALVIALTPAASEHIEESAS